jgi:hypothetical protein
LYGIVLLGFDGTAIRMRRRDRSMSEFHDDTSHYPDTITGERPCPTSILSSFLATSG